MRYWEYARSKAGRTKGTARGKRTGRSTARRTKSTAEKRSVTATGSLLHYPFLRAFYNHQARIGTRLQKFLFLLIVSTLLYVFVFGEAGAIRLLSLKYQRDTLAQTVASMESDAVALEEAIERLKNDPFAIEKIGRERYGYVRPGDRVYKLVYPKRSP